MQDGNILFIAAVFFLAGLIKGVIGLGLPTVSMGLLAIVMTPLQAAAILVLPSFITNVWQMAGGPSLLPMVRRLWPMQAGVCLGTWAGAGLMSGSYTRYSSTFLGAALVIYAVTGFGSARVFIDATRQRWLGPLAGTVTGLITAATGVFVIPSVPYLQAIGLEKEEFVQALGLSFTVSTLALAVNLASAGALDVAVAAPMIVALTTACAGMWIGQILRLRAPPEIFRRIFFIGLFVLGTYIFIDALR
jgi:uncharacterized protein